MKKVNPSKRGFGLKKWSWPRKWCRRAFALGTGALLTLGTARADGPNTPVTAAPPTASSTTELLKRLDQLEKSNKDLQKKIETMQTGGIQPAGGQNVVPAADGAVSADAVKKIVGDYLKDQDAQKKAAEDAAKAEGVRVYSNLNLRGYVDNNGYPWLATPNNDFTMHWGAWAQYDNVWWTQQANLVPAPAGRPVAGAAGAAYRAATGTVSGPAVNGIGDLQDGTYFRRIRPFVEGTVWENGEYRLILALENMQFNTTGLDEFWIGWNNIPVIGTVRAGHVKSTIGLEADMTASSRCMTFMERSIYSEAIENNINFVTGLWLGNNFLDQHLTYSANLARVDLAQATGTFFGDGQWFAAGRLTALPLYSCDGRHWLHLGLSGSYRNGADNTTAGASGPGGVATPLRLFQMRARPQLRDDNPAGGGGGVVANANSNRMIDTGTLVAAGDYTLGTEFVYVRGPLSFQAEYGWNFLNDAIGTAPLAAGITPGVVIAPAQNYTFDGGYVQLAYTLTGEARGYDRARGTLSRPYFPGGPFSPAYINRNADGGFCHSLGALELAVRYDYTNLNSGTGATRRVEGGRMQGVSLGVNWYLNSNMTIMFDYVYDYRYNLPQAVGATPAVQTGAVDGFGTRVQLSF
jgi:phosphate-selective porin OprO/OprP